MGGESPGSLSRHKGHKGDGYIAAESRKRQGAHSKEDMTSLKKHRGSNTQTTENVPALGSPLADRPPIRVKKNGQDVF